MQRSRQSNECKTREPRGGVSPPLGVCGFYSGFACVRGAGAPGVSRVPRPPIPFCLREVVFLAGELVLLLGPAVDTGLSDTLADGRKQ